MVYALSARGKNAKGVDIDFSAPAFIEDFGVVEAVVGVADGCRLDDQADSGSISKSPSSSVTPSGRRQDSPERTGRWRIGPGGAALQFSNLRRQDKRNT